MYAHSSRIARANRCFYNNEYQASADNCPPGFVNPMLVSRLAERCFVGSHSCGNTIVVHVPELEPSETNVCGLLFFIES
jgi:hypothetical protein